MVLFLSEYPNDASSKDGMFQRISSVDSHFTNQKRAYLRVSITGDRRKIVLRNGLVTIYYLNFFLHFLLLLKLFRSASLIYIHSLHNIRRCTIPLILSSKCPVALDVHGVVPEEEEYRGYPDRSKFFANIERRLFKMRNLTIVAVTDSMANYYRQKYPQSTFSNIKYAIFPSHLTGEVDFAANKNDGIVNFVYAGNLQKWQNVELMIDSISKIINNNSYKFYILTGELEKMTAIFETKIGKHSNLEILSVSPQELKNYYLDAHYGFVLRDDIIVNRVACPTKLVEYMYYGLIPIVLSEYLGDFNDMGYEYIKLDNLMHLDAKKSSRNMEIIKRLNKENLSTNFQFLKS